MCWLAAFPNGEHDTRRLQQAASGAVGPLTAAEARRVLDWAVARHQRGVTIASLLQSLEQPSVVRRVLTGDGRAAQEAAA
jgi:hypothetical protein